MYTDDYALDSEQDPIDRCFTSIEALLCCRTAHLILDDLKSLPLALRSRNNLRDGHVENVVVMGPWKRKWTVLSYDRPKALRSLSPVEQNRGRRVLYSVIRVVESCGNRALIFEGSKVIFFEVEKARRIVRIPIFLKKVLKFTMEI